MKKYILILIFSVFATSCFSQGNPIIVQDSVSLTAFSYNNGDLLAIGYDSAYVLNKTVFKLYTEAYAQLKKKSPEIQRLLGVYDELITKQDSALMQKEIYYKGLKQSFDSLAANATDFTNKTESKINAIDQSLTKATDEIKNVKAKLDDALEKLKKENGRKLGWAAGGLVVGACVTAIIFVISK